MRWRRVVLPKALAQPIHCGATLLYHHHYHTAPAASAADPTDPSSSPLNDSPHGHTSSSAVSASAPWDTAAAAAAPALPPRELRIFAEFAQSEEDLHWALLLEAHRKHGVWLSVPPQAPPTIPHVGPPMIPDVIFPAAQRARMATMSFAYPPTHDPPPLWTTGSRSLQVDEDIGSAAATPPQQRMGELPEQERKLMEEVRQQTSPTTSSPPFPPSPGGKPAPRMATTSTGTTAPSIQTVAKRAPVDTTMRFHCSVCGKAFRKLLNATAHVETMHKGNKAEMMLAAKVEDGPGPGEIVGSEDVVVLAAVPVKRASPEGERSSSSSSSSPLLAQQQGGARHPAASAPPPSVKTQYDIATVALPDDDVIDQLLTQTWDAVGLGREDIAKPAGLPLDPANPKRLLRTLSTDGVGSTPEQAHGAAAATSSLHPQQQRWDSGGGAFFVPAALVVEGKADRRKELAALQAAKPTARATPEGAAPGIKRRPSASSASSSSSSSAAAAAVARVGLVSVLAGSGGAARKWLPIRELNKQYPNPFGNTASAAFLAELEKQPVNPFVDLEKRKGVDSGEKEDEAAVAVAASDPSQKGVEDKEPGLVSEGMKRELYALLASRPFTCPLCEQTRAVEAEATVPHEPSAPHMSSVSQATPAPATTLMATAGVDLSRRFRLLDSLLDHVEQVHGSLDVLGEAAMDRFYDVEANPIAAVKQELREVLARLSEAGRGREQGEASSSSSTGGSAGGGTGASGASSSAGAGISSGGCGDDGGDRRSNSPSDKKADKLRCGTGAAENEEEAECMIPTVPQEQVHVHARAPVNAILVGTVKDIQEGFLQDAPVMQLVMAVQSPMPNNVNGATEKGSSGDAVAAQGEPIGEKSGEVEREEELIVVRCVGGDDSLPRSLLRQRLHINSSVYIEGSLRMNRHVDAVSKRSHAYPYVQVAPPMGVVRPL